MEPLMQGSVVTCAASCNKYRLELDSEKPWAVGRQILVKIIGQGDFELVTSPLWISVSSFII